MLPSCTTNAPAMFSLIYVLNYPLLLLKFDLMMRLPVVGVMSGAKVVMASLSLVPVAREGFKFFGLIQNITLHCHKRGLQGDRRELC